MTGGLNVEEQSRSNYQNRVMNSAVSQGTESRPFGRRPLLLASLTARPKAAGAAAHPPDEGRTTFRLIRHGGEIGRHVIAFSRDGDLLTVQVSVDAQVSLLSVPLVTYRHRATEIWHNESLLTLTGETDKNGQHEWVRAHRGAAGLEVTGSKTKPYVASEPVGLTSYWNKAHLAYPMISLEDGVLLKPKVEIRGIETIVQAAGTGVTATHYALSGDFTVDLWYDESGHWAGMAVTVADGSLVRYERL